VAGTALGPFPMACCRINSVAMYHTHRRDHVISGFRREIEEIWALLGHYASYGGNSLSTFRDNLSFSTLRFAEPLR
jgi:hypothetical protein